MGKIDSKSKLTPEEYLSLFLFDRYGENIEIEYSKFRPTQSLIEKYNAYLKSWQEKFESNPAQFEKAVDWDIDRPKTDNYKKQLEVGQEFQVWVETEFKKYGVDIGIFNDSEGQFSGECKLGIEIKNDAKSLETGNTYFEIKERLKGTGEWVDSGVCKEDNSKYYLIGYPEKYYIFVKSDIVAFYESIKERLTNGGWIEECKYVREFHKEGQRTVSTSEGFVMKPKKALEMAYSTSIEDFVRRASACVGVIETGYYHMDKECGWIGAKNSREYLFDIEEAKEKYKPCACCNNT